MSVVDGDLLARVREFAAGYPEPVVSSSSLAAQLGVTPKAVSAVLAPLGVRSRRLSANVRGYDVGELAAAVDPGEPVVGVLAVLSAGAGHDMTGALRAAGWAL